jgi:hypothetical protein
MSYGTSSAVFISTSIIQIVCFYRSSCKNGVIFENRRESARDFKRLFD